MNGALPEELLDTIQQQILLRQSQLQQLSLFYNVANYPSPTTLVAYGPEDTCKHEAIEHVLGKNHIEYTLIDCRECLSQRHLLTKIFSKVVKLLDKEDDDDRYDRLDNINALGSNLRKVLHKREDKLVLVVTNADQQKGATATLFPALARLGDLIPCLSLVFTSTVSRPLPLCKTGVPYIYFPPYKRNEAIQILLRDPPPLLPNPLPEYTPALSESTIRHIFSQFATVVYDTLIAPTTISMSQFRTTCTKLWPRFIWPLINGESVPGARSTDWNFAQLVARGRSLFQAEGEETLQDRLVASSTQPITFEELIATRGTETTQDTQPPEKPLLKYLPTLLLLSCYLASHTPSKHDIVLFSRLSTASSTSRRKRKYLVRSRAGGITKNTTKAKATGNGDGDGDEQTTTPKKKSKEVTNSAATPKKERADRSMRAIFEKTSNIARPFALERVIAILRAIHPDGVARGVADRVYSELGELERLRLVGRVDGKGGAEDIMEERWKCVVGKEWVVSAGGVYGVGLEGWEVE